MKLRAGGAGVSHARTDITVRDLAFTIDEPAERGGTNTGPAPTEAALAALIGCTNVIGQRCADALGIDVGHLSIDVAADLDRRGVTLAEEVEVPFVSLKLTVTSDGPASAEELQRVAAEVAKYCPLSKLFRAAGTDVEEIWQKA
ncbi:MAG: OsmC family protein [Pseudomonadota bacterium]